MDNTFVAKRIKELRERKNLSANALANLAGISPTYIYQLEQALKSPTVEYLSYICEALGISLSDFFGSNDTVDSEKSVLDELTDEQKGYLSDFVHSIKNQ